MARLYRPTIPVEVKCRVALRQLGEIWPDRVIMHNKGQLGDLLTSLLDSLSGLLGCEKSELRLDHDPPLGARPRERRGLGKKTYYVPDANDPEHLLYRPHGPQHDGSHLIKTNVRGEHGQHPDRVLIKKQRRIEARAAGKPERRKAKIPGKTFQQSRCRAGARCRCDRRQRKRCANWRKP